MEKREKSEDEYMEEMKRKLDKELQELERRERFQKEKDALRAPL